MNLNLSEKIIIVTGGAKGIGDGIARAVAAENAIPVIVGRKEADSLKAIESISNKGFQVVAELTKPEECENAVKKIVDKFGRIDGLVNNAGVVDGVGLEKGNYEQFVASLHENLVQYYLMTHHALPYLKQSKGVIVNIGSRITETGRGQRQAYGAFNGGTNALTREWAVELLPYSVRVNAVIVSEWYTPSTETLKETFENPEEELKSKSGKIPLEHRVATPEEIANLVVFLLSEKSSHTTGQLLHVAGW